MTFSRICFSCFFATRKSTSSASSLPGTVRSIYEADLKRFKAAEIAKTEAENLEIVRIIRAMDMSIPELEAFKKRMKNELPGRVEIQKEETKADDESGKNETEEENNY